MIVDATSETPRLVAIRDHVETWKRLLPLTRFKVVPYARQDLRYADANMTGWREATGRYLWTVGRYDVPLAGCFSALFKTLLAHTGDVIVVSGTAAPDASVRHVEIGALDRAGLEPVVLRREQSEALLAAAVRATTVRRGALPPSEAVSEFAEGIFGGPRTGLLDESACGFDTRLITNLSVTEWSRRLGRRGVPIVRSGIAFSRSILHRLTDGGPAWEAIHDLRRLDEPVPALPDDASELIDIVCPFHRGDVILAVQVAARAASAGKRVRLHVAQALVAWAQEFGGGIEVHAVPVPVAAAQDTYPVLLDAYQYVCLRSDGAPRIARCHPSRSLSETGRNLVDYMLEEVGLPPDTRLANLRPESSDEQRRIARELVDAIGGKIVFVHPLGGWHLKSIPPHIMAELAHEMRGAGFKLVQIGAANDRRVEHTDGAILQNFMPSQWRAILALGRALVGVDSWTSHFGAILDTPQICLYGSTNPVHVSSKRWFQDQENPCLNLGPIVNCSPCNSLSCVAWPERNYCTGYAIDRAALADFLTGTAAREPELRKAS
ncbi:glycosyltransferase family 9 protein [Paraburkholderia acidisoli]|uniref:glycosyltransferase family 9 protein n=1 Tax=Paraburkholderia acidisoli TaxID=2571748 RepID=UPI001E489820|nr:glycosyltransferase family 9 protein [Paraburkholderia acidisoli]